MIPLDAILMLAGRLEDEPGFDAPRQRFRRFLLGHVTDVAALRGLVESCQNAPGDQHHRALRDLAVVLGRFLGFETTFGVYQQAAHGVRDDGLWRSGSRLQVVLDVRFEQADTQIRPYREGQFAARTCALCVTTPLFAGRRRIETAAASARLEIPMVIVGLGTLLSLAELAGAGKVSHDDVVRLLENEMPIEFVIELLERATGGQSRAPEAAPVVFLPPSSAGDQPTCWLATVAGDLDAAPEEFLRLVVGGRHLFGVPETGAPAPVARPGDAICFHIPGKGVVGHARVQALASGHTAMRAAHRFRQLLQLDEPWLHLDTPIPLDADTQLRLRTTSSRSARQASTFIKISRESYSTFTVSDAGRASVPPSRRVKAGP